MNIDDIDDTNTTIHTTMSKHERAWRAKVPRKEWGWLMDIYKAIMVSIVQDDAYAGFHSNSESKTLIDEHGSYNALYVIEETKRIFHRMHPEVNAKEMGLDGMYYNLSLYYISLIAFKSSTS